MMRSLEHFCLEVPADTRVLLFDIDDTITTAGLLTADAYAAVARAKAAGLIVIPITGRPAGWCDHIARMWPVDGVIGENGAFYFRCDRVERKYVRRFMASAGERLDNRQRLNAAAARVLADVPGSAMASDNPYREADVAIDYCEDIPRLPAADVIKIRTIMEDEGLTARASGSHVNGWIGDFNKLTTAKLMLHEVFGIDLDAEKSRVVFVGDAPNDEPMFEFFPFSVGVANVRDFQDQLRSPPAYITESRYGAGFGEVVDAMLAARVRRS